jgi:hypothetical protein
LIAEAGLSLVHSEDVSAAAALVAGRWHRARAAHRDELAAIEGPERFDGLQEFLRAVERLTAERRLSRVAYVAANPGACPHAARAATARPSR